eukprot:9702558-Lingulodinium_polyedra.AAC.1
MHGVFDEVYMSRARSRVVIGHLQHVPRCLDGQLQHAPRRRARCQSSRPRHGVTATSHGASATSH